MSDEEAAELRKLALMQLEAAKAEKRDEEEEEAAARVRSAPCRGLQVATKCARRRLAGTIAWLALTSGRLLAHGTRGRVLTCVYDAYLVAARVAPDTPMEEAAPGAAGVVRPRQRCRG